MQISVTHMYTDTEGFYLMFVVIFGLHLKNNGSYIKKLGGTTKPVLNSTQLVHAGSGEPNMQTHEIKKPANFKYI